MDAGWKAACSGHNVIPQASENWCRTNMEIDLNLLHEGAPGGINIAFRATLFAYDLLTGRSERRYSLSSRSAFGFVIPPFFWVSFRSAFLVCHSAVLLVVIPQAPFLVCHSVAQRRNLLSLEAAHLAGKAHPQWKLHPPTDPVSFHKAFTLSFHTTTTPSF
jgi:hypothetical protein